MKNMLKLTFLTDSNEKGSFNIQHPYLDIDETEVNQAMQDIIASSAMMLKTGLLVTAQGAELVTVTEQTYNV